MVRRAERIAPRRYETYLKLEKFFGLQTFGPHSTHQPGEFLTLENFDLFRGYMKERRGSSALNDAVHTLADRQVLAGTVWDTGADEYAIVQLVDVAGTGCEFWTIQLNASAPFTQVPSLTIASVEQAELFISNDRCYVFNPVANKVIEFRDGIFNGRPMGLPMSFISSVAAASVGSGNLTGRYTYGVELVYQVVAVDRLAASPSRQIVTTRVVNSITLTASNATIVMDSVIPAANTLWTHARLWRSKNQNIDYSTPANPRDAQGTDSELYLLQTIDRATFVAGSYTFTDTQTDANIPATADFVDLERIELEALPPAHVGVQHRGRIWVTRAQGVDDTSQANLYYSNFAGTKYCEQYDPENVVYAEPGDGQRSVKLISLERDLICIKEAKTGRVQDGNPDNGFETLDYRIGISHKRAAAYIPGIGIAAITNDLGDFRIFGYELRWTNQWGGTDISRFIRVQTSALTLSQVSFLYLNGKLWVSDGTGVYYVLHSEQGLGWSKYEYPMNSRAEVTLAFANNSRGLVISRNTCVVEIEKSEVATDINTLDNTTAVVTCSLTTHRFQSNGGRDVIEAKYLSLIATMSATITGFPYGNGLPWPDGAVAVSTNFIIDAGTYTQTALRQREYRLYLEEPVTCNHVHYELTATAPIIIQDIRLACLVDEIGMGESFDPYGVVQTVETMPSWSEDLIDGGVDDETITDELDGGVDDETVTDETDGATLS